MPSTRPLAVLILVLGAFSAGAVNAAEVININYRYKVAFSDLTQNEVGAGDVVDVRLADGRTLPLRVLESYPVMSKLGVLDDDPAVSDEQFRAINVGSPVIKRGRGTVTASQKAVAPAAGSPATLSQPQKAAAEERAVVSVPSEEAGSGHCAELEKRFDQLVVSNIKLTENITSLLAAKNVAEARATEAPRNATNRTGCADKVVLLQGTVDTLEQDKVALQKEVDDLKLKMAELKKKLSRMVELVGANTAVIGNQ